MLVKSLKNRLQITSKYHPSRHKKDRKPSKIKVSGAPAKESMRQDLNLRPLRPERSALPS